MEFSFQWFKDAVRSKGEIWQSGNVRFMQFRDGYGVVCTSDEVDGSKKKYGLTYDTETNMWRNVSPEEFVAAESLVR